MNNLSDSPFKMSVWRVVVFGNRSAYFRFTATDDRLKSCKRSLSHFISKGITSQMTSDDRSFASTRNLQSRPPLELLANWMPIGFDPLLISSSSADQMKPHIVCGWWWDQFWDWTVSTVQSCISPSIEASSGMLSSLVEISHSAKSSVSMAASSRPLSASCLS